jgi:hypothetical protein
MAAERMYSTGCAFRVLPRSPEAEVVMVFRL